MAAKKSEILSINYIDMPKIKQAVLADPLAYRPEELVNLFKKHYTTLASASSSISKFKKQLSLLADPPPSSYLVQLRLPKKDQVALRAAYARQRDSRGSPEEILVIRHVAEILARARDMLHSHDWRDNLAAIFPLTGLRPIEVLRTLRFKKGKGPSRYTAWVKGFAKQGNNLGTVAREAGAAWRVKFFLAARTDVVAAVRRIRQNLKCEQGMTNEQISNKYGNKIGRTLKSVWGDLMDNPTAYKFRKMYALVSFEAQGEPEGFSLTRWASEQLGHCLTSDTVLAYVNARLEDTPDGWFP